MAWRIPSVLVLCKKNLVEWVEENCTTGDNVVTGQRQEVTDRHREAQAKV